MGDVPDYLQGAVPGSWALSGGSFHSDADPDCTPAERRPGVPHGDLHHRRRFGNHVSTSQPVSRMTYQHKQAFEVQSPRHIHFFSSQPKFHNPKQFRLLTKKQHAQRKHTSLVCCRQRRKIAQPPHDVSGMILEIMHWNTREIPRLYDRNNTQHVNICFFSGLKTARKALGTHLLDAVKYYKL